MAFSFRGNPVDGWCPVCKGVRETGFHALWGCSSLKELRSAVDGWVGIVGLPEMPLIDLLGAAKDKMLVVDFELLYVFLYRVWFRRNRAIHGQLLIPAGEIADWSASFLQEY
ncbi:hypothetical protein ACOSP7_019457 [Xanthoceras sorbifolium]